MSHEEQQYLNLIRDILDKGSLEQGRNGNTISVFGASMRFSLAEGTVPILTTKKTAWVTCLKELLWFIRGETDNKLLQAEGVHIWDGNASPDFMESRGLGHYPEGILGPIYGYQWRKFNADYTLEEANNEGLQSPKGLESPLPKGLDQLQSIIDQLKDPAQRTSRRLIMTAWNPCQLEQMALPPCHIMCQFNVHGGNKLSCAMYQRSCDVGLGVPFNIASYSFLTHLLAKHCGLEAHEFVYFLGNAHIYDDHLEAMKQQVAREPFSFPKVQISVCRDNINDYQVGDFVVTGYKCHEPIKMNMRK